VIDAWSDAGTRADRRPPRRHATKLSIEFIAAHNRNLSFISARCNIYIARLCYDVSVRLSVCLSVTEVHCGHGACRDTAAAPASEVEAIIRFPTNMAAADGGVISRYASHCLSLLYYYSITAWRGQC